MNETTFAVVFTVLCLALYGLLKLAAWSERRHAKVEAEANAVIEAATERHLFLAVDDPTTEDEPMVPIVPGSTEPELVDDLPVRAQAIEVPRVGEPGPKGAVLQGRWRPHTRCFDAYVDREPSRICRDCAPVFGRTAVEA